MKFYRYIITEYASVDRDGEFVSSSFPNPKLEINEYNLYKETPKGYWIGYGLFNYGKLRSHARWIPKASKKRFAYPTKEEALKNFIARTNKRIRITSWQLDMCKIGVRLAEQLKRTLGNV